MDAAPEIGRNPVSKHQIQSECREWAGWRGTGRLKPSRETKFSGANGDNREIFIFPVQLTTSRISNLTRLIHTLLPGICDDRAFSWVTCGRPCGPGPPTTTTSSCALGSVYLVTTAGFVADQLMWEKQQQQQQLLCRYSHIRFAGGCIWRRGCDCSATCAPPDLC